MNEPVILEIFDSKHIFDRKVIKNDYKLFSTVSIPGKRRLIKIFARTIINTPVIVKKQSDNHPLIKNKVCAYNRISIEAVAAVIEKVCKKVADKCSVKIPFNEIIIIGSEEIAYTLIYPLVNICRMFTVVSDSYNLKKTDEMYFKYGCIIRNKSKPENPEGGDNLLICADERVNCENFNMQIINLTNTGYTRNNIINIRDVMVVDDRILSIAQKWNGSPGLEMYDLLGIIPSCDSDVDTNTKADKIFLLDINKI